MNTHMSTKHAYVEFNEQILPGVCVCVCAYIYYIYIYTTLKALSANEEDRKERL